MSHLPDSSFITRYLFENPWPILLLFGITGLVIGGLGLRDGVASRIKVAAVLLVIAGTALLTDRLKLTSGEQAEATVREFVDAVAAVDMAKVRSLLAPDCAWHVGAPTNPGGSMAWPLSTYESFTDGQPLEDHSITSLKYASASDDVGEVQMAVGVSTSRGGGFSAWHLRVRRNGGVWQVTDITILRLNGQEPSVFGVR